MIIFVRSTKFLGTGTTTNSTY